MLPPASSGVTVRTAQYMVMRWTRGRTSGWRQIRLNQVSTVSSRMTAVTASATVPSAVNSRVLRRNRSNWPRTASTFWGRKILKTKDSRSARIRSNTGKAASMENPMAASGTTASNVV